MSETGPHKGELTRFEALRLSLALWGSTFGIVIILKTIADDLNGMGERFELLLHATAALVLSLVIRPTWLALQGRPVWLAWSGAFILVIALGCALTAVPFLLTTPLQVLFSEVRPPNVSALAVTQLALSNIVAYALNAGLIWMVGAGNRARALAVAEAEAKAAAARAELKALRLQLNPHFLFNIMNSLATLVALKRTEDAEATIVKLSDILRSALNASEETTVPLHQELATVRAYLELETLRFGERLVFDLQCPEPLKNALLPDFILQPLVENAVKHGLGQGETTTVVRITAQASQSRLILTIEDDGQGGRGADTSGLGVGLANTAQRLEAVYGGAATLVSTAREPGYQVVLTLPLDFVAYDMAV